MSEGIGARVVAVEADIAPGLPQFSIVGLPDSAVNESKLRVRSAIRNAGLEFPARRITVNLSPASLRKRGAGLDLAIAVAILRASRQVPADGPPLAFAAELGLDGTLQPVHGITALAAALRQAGTTDIVLAPEALNQIVDVPGCRWLPARSLTEVAERLRRPDRQWPAAYAAATAWSLDDTLDMADVEGLEDIKRALTVAAVGRHPTLLVGPPGCGKTMLAERMVTILPPLDEETALAVFAIHQAAGSMRRPSLTPPLRAPHHSLTAAGLVGGGNPPAAGEATLAHHGVLLFDELLEFPRSTLEALREPLSTRQLVIARAGHTHVLPADFLFIGTLNPCPCGWYGTSRCRCLDTAVYRYWSKLSGPILDRMDLVLHVTPHEAGRPAPAGLNRPAHPGIGSASLGSKSDSRTLRDRVTQARRLLPTLQGPLPSEAATLLREAGRALQLSHRGIDAVARVARSIAALDGADRVLGAHVAQALAWRGGDRPARSVN